MRLVADLPDLSKLVRYSQKHARPHLWNIYEAILANRLMPGLVVRDDDYYAFRSDLPMLVTVSDDIDGSFGPTRFNPRTIEDLIRSCGAATIISIPPEPFIYDQTVAVALSDNINIVIIETDMTHEGAWLKHLTGINPNIRYALWSPQSRGGMDG